MTKTIFITGASKGFGKIWTEKFLNLGYNVAAIARNTETLNELASKFESTLLTVQLDVTDRQACFKAIDIVNSHFGKIDILINNAATGMFGAIEENTEEEARRQFDTNFFGLLWLTQSVLPIMRNQKSGHIIQISSTLGVVPMPLTGIYNATKFAIEGLSETLADEVKDFGIKVTLVEPNAYATETALSGSSDYQTKPLEDYNTLKNSVIAGFNENFYGVPDATADAMASLITMNQPPLHFFLGKFGFDAVKKTYQKRLNEWQEWKELSVQAHGK